MSASKAAEVDPSELAPRHDIPEGGRSGFTVIEDRQVHYLEWGHRGLPPVLALHGGGQTAYMYEELGAALANRYYVLAPDLPSHGDSDQIPPESFGREALAETIPPLLDRFGVESCPIVGASLGGITAITLGARRPELVSGIVLIDVGHRLEEAGVRKIVDFMRAHESFGSLDDARAAIAQYLPQRKNVRPEKLTRNLRQRADGRWVWKHDMGRRWRQRNTETDDGSLKLDHVLAGLGEEASRLACPVLVLRGSASDVLSAEGADEIVDLIPHARLAVVDRAGHLAAGDNPTSTVAEITRFLDEIAFDVR